MENNDRMREEFEARWAQQNPGIDPQRAGDFYYNDAAQIAWSWWKAGYLQASSVLAL